MSPEVRIARWLRHTAGWLQDRKELAIDGYDDERAFFDGEKEPEGERTLALTIPEAQLDMTIQGLERAAGFLEELARAADEAAGGWPDRR